MTRKYLAAPILVSAFALSSLTQPALAQTASTPTKAAATAAKPGAEAQELMKFSQDGNSAIRDIAGARVAIFDGDPSRPPPRA